MRGTESCAPPRVEQPSDGAIHTHINNLRAKIEEDPARPEIIRTVRGLGHVLDG